MGNKKKKAGSHRSHLKHQKLLDNFQLNDSAVLALTAPPPTVHATVTSNSNSNSKQRPPVASTTVCSRPALHELSSPHGPAHPYHGDPSINHIFVEDWYSDDDLEDEEVDFNSPVEDYVGASTFFTPPVVGASPAGGQSTPIAFPAVAQSTPPPLPPVVGSISPPLQKTMMSSSLPSICCVSPTFNIAGAQSTPLSLPPAEKIPSPPLEKLKTPSSLPPGYYESSPSEVAVDLSEELQHSVQITLPEGPALHQQVVYETLPKYCHLCHVLGHTHLLCPKATAIVTTSLAPAVQEAQGNVFSRLGPGPPLQSPPPLPQLQDRSKD
ncbi:hypothetical protein Peur_008322 [Populus x canadensis]